MLNIWITFVSLTAWLDMKAPKKHIVYMRFFSWLRCVLFEFVFTTTTTTKNWHFSWVYLVNSIYTSIKTNFEEKTTVYLALHCAVHYVHCVCVVAVDFKPISSVSFFSSLCCCILKFEIAHQILSLSLSIHWENNA